MDSGRSFNVDYTGWVPGGGTFGLRILDCGLGIGGFGIADFGFWIGIADCGFWIADWNWDWDWGWDVVRGWFVIDGVKDVPSPYLCQPDVGFCDCQNTSDSLQVTGMEQFRLGIGVIHL